MMRYLMFPVAVVCVLAPAQAQNQARVAGALIGEVVDDRGRPIAGAEVTVRYQSNPGGVSLTKTARTNARGRYHINLIQPPGVWSAHAKAKVVVDGHEMLLDLTPDSEELFAGNLGAVRNFRLRYTESTASDPYGTGGMLVVASAVGDYTSLDEVMVTLQPVTGGAPIERRLRNTGEGWVVTGLRPQAYRVTARHQGRALQISPALTPHRDYRWSTHYEGGFERTGPGIYQMRIEIRSR